jgi:HSF-type DNA-binding
MQTNEPITSSSLSPNAGVDLDENKHNELGDFGEQTFEDRNGQHHPIAEFLYQLTKLLTDDNSEIIEWADGRIKVHHPERLEGEVLHKYFRHSKFASFQRQLNYFGFRKIAGKGKMSPCSYVNEAATSDIRSLLLIKRKTNGTAARKAAMHQRAAALVSSAGLNPAFATMNFAALTGDQNALSVLNNQALSSAMALLSENALRASVGQLPPMQQTVSNQLAATPQIDTNQLNLYALQQQHQRLQKQLQEQQQQQQQQQQQAQFQLNQFGTDQLFQNKLMGLQALQLQGDASNQSLTSSSTPSLEQLQAHLAALTQQQQQEQQLQSNGLNQSLLNRNLASAAFLAAGGNGANAFSSFNAATAALNPASAALSRANGALNVQPQATGTNAMPATAAMDAASATSQMNNNLFDSAANLKSLLNEHQQQQNEQAQQVAAANQASFFNRLPSSSALFPENSSTMSFGNLLGSSNRLNSLLSLNSFLGSREASLADFAAAMPANVRDQLVAGAAAGGVAAAAVAAQVRNDANKFRSHA